MKTAFLVTKYELFGSVLELGETIAELKKNGYERCVIVDSSLSSFVKWHTALSRAGIVTVPGLHKGNDYWIARSEKGFRELMKSEIIESDDLVHVLGKPRNLDPSSKNPIWECRYLDQNSERFRTYTSLGDVLETSDYSLPDERRYLDMEKDLGKLLSELPDLDAILVPVGGGGLLAGMALAIRTFKPEVKIIGVQSENAPAVCQIFKKKEITGLAPFCTIADGINVCRPGRLTVELINRYVDDLVLVNEEEIAESILLLLERSKIVVEGAGAVGLAALLHRKISLPGKKVVVLLSGGNVDTNIISLIIERGLINSGRRLVVSLLLPDQPGSLSRLLVLLAEACVNLISINHDRVKPEVPLREAEVRLVLETRNRDHLHLVLDLLTKNGYRINGFLAAGGVFTTTEG